MATRKGRLRCHSATRLLPLEINADILRHANGSCRPVETSRHRQNRSQSLPKGARCVQHDLEQSHPEYYDQHSTRWRSGQLLIERGVGAVQETEPSHRLLWEEGKWGLQPSPKKYRQQVNWEGAPPETRQDLCPSRYAKYDVSDYCQQHFDTLWD